MHMERKLMRLEESVIPVLYTQDTTQLYYEIPSADTYALHSSRVIINTANGKVTIPTLLSFDRDRRYVVAPDITRLIELMHYMTIEHIVEPELLAHKIATLGYVKDNETEQAEDIKKRLYIVSFKTDRGWIVTYKERRWRSHEILSLTKNLGYMRLPRYVIA